MPKITDLPQAASVASSDIVPVVTGGITSKTSVSSLVQAAVAAGGTVAWNAGNDGAGSGLDADTVDGQHASAFASASHTHPGVFLVHGFHPGKPANSALVLAVLPSVACSFAAGLTGSRAKAGTAATAQTVFSVQKNGVEVGTITFAASGTTGTFAAASPVSLTTADELTVVAPASADATLADLRLTLNGAR